MSAPESGGPPQARPATPRGRVKVTPRSHKDPEMLSLDETTLREGQHYRWVRSRADEHNASVTKHKMKGYKLVTKEDGVRTHVEADDRPDGVIAIGDMILMSCPQEVYDKRATERRQLNEARLSSTVAVTKQMAKEKGVEIISDRDHED